MMGHQRDILATMGIDIWIPRSVARVQHSQPSGLWRDQAQPEIITELALSQVELPVSGESDIPEIDNALTQFFEIEQENVQQTLKPATPVAVELQSQSAIQIEAFELQAVSLATCLIVLDASYLTEAQAELWANIQQAIPAEYHELKWPFPLLEMQDGRGAVSYVQGFIDAIGVDKDLIALGDIPHLQQVELHRLASLQEMLEQPILKKRLWQFMQRSLNTRMNDE